MKQYKIILTLCLSLIAVLLVAYGCKRASGVKMLLCTHPYALCTSARCIPQPGDPSKAICTCDVEEGESMSTTPCHALLPSTDKHGIGTIYSTFSYKQYRDGKKVMKCPGGTPWTWCLNKRCTVDPGDPKKAICLCDVVRSSEEWITFGGDCDVSTCNTAYWSGVGMTDFAEGNVFMTQKLGLDLSPVRWCEIEHP